MAQLIRLRCVQGLQYFNLVSDNLLMSFSVSFNLVVFSGMKNMEAVHNSLGIFTSIKSSKIPLLVSVEVEAGPWPKIALLLGCSCLCILSLFWLAIVNICPLRLWEGHGGSSLFPANKDQEIQKGFHTQKRHRVLLSFRVRPLKMAALVFSVIPCSTSARFTYALLPGLTFLYTCACLVSGSSSL